MTSKEKGVAILAYFGPLFLLALFLTPESRFAKFHANQGLLLFLFEVIIGIIIGVGKHLPLVGWTFQFLRFLPVILFFLGLSHAIRETEDPLPFIGGFELLK